MYVFFFKQKTAYEMRISDWSSDVCSSDLSCSVTTSPSNGATTVSPSGWIATPSPIIRWAKTGSGKSSSVVAHPLSGEVMIWPNALIPKTSAAFLAAWVLLHGLRRAPCPSRYKLSAHPSRARPTPVTQDQERVRMGKGGDDRAGFG